RTPTAANAEYYARIVRDKWLARQTILAAREVQRTYSPGRPAAELVAGWRDWLDRLAPASAGLALTYDDELTTAAPDWLVDRLLVAGSLGLLYGPPAAGKSLLALDWACSIATGEPWLGRPVRPGPVLYVAAEGSAGLGVRVAAWR